jgi:hypothetical protein
MRTDLLASFVPFGAAQSMVGGDGVDVPFANVIDLMGSGVGTAPPNTIGNATLFGEDIGVGPGYGELLLNITIGTAFTTSNSATANFKLQAAADQGVSGNYQPSTWNTIAETGAIAVGSLTAGTVVGRFSWPPNFPANLNPRYIRIIMTPAAATHFTAGTILFAGLVPARDDQSNKYAASNFKVS